MGNAPFHHVTPAWQLRNAPCLVSSPRHYAWSCLHLSLSSLQPSFVHLGATWGCHSLWGWDDEHPQCVCRYFRYSLRRIGNNLFCHSNFSCPALLVVWVLCSNQDSHDMIRCCCWCSCLVIQKCCWFCRKVADCRLECHQHLHLSFQVFHLKLTPSSPILEDRFCEFQTWSNLCLQTILECWMIGPQVMIYAFGVHCFERFECPVCQ